MNSFKRIDDEFFIGTQPSEQDLQAAQQQGIKTVIDSVCRPKRQRPTRR
jgi:protein tyrosine phosphatase (PTP) superfamily phosphohydrolase (DUF442 family)